ncbi:MAG: LrgB family protein [Clostridia bacterium]|nr:LrgB family protein [Clostridia bacterium]
MNELLQHSSYFGVFLSLLSYFAGMYLKKKFKWAIFNPLLVAVVLTIGVLLLFDIDYDTYNQSASYLSVLLTPATVCLAIPLYAHFKVLKKHYRAILIGIASGVLVSLLSVLLLSWLFGLDHAMYVTMLPKSITTAIGMSLSMELGGYAAMTVAAIVLTGVLGNMIAEGVCRLFGIEDPIAKGVGIGTASHAIGTSRAMMMGEVEGAMSSLSIVVAGVMTVLGAGIFAGFL